MKLSLRLTAKKHILFFIIIQSLTREVKLMVKKI